MRVSLLIESLFMYHFSTTFILRSPYIAFDINAGPEGPGLCNYVQASSPQSSTSSLCDGTTLTMTGSPVATIISASLVNGVSHLNGMRDRDREIERDIEREHERERDREREREREHDLHTHSSLHGHHANSSLPHKLRHKHTRPIASADSDTERGECNTVNVAAEAVSSDLPREAATKPDVIRQTNLKEENFTLRAELQRLATEVSALKHFLTPINAYATSESGTGRTDRCVSSPTNADDEEMNSEQVDDAEGQNVDRVSTVSCSSESGFSSEDAGSQRDND